MKTILKIGSLIGLMMTALPAIFYFLGVISLKGCHLWMIFGMAIWFFTAPFWINSKVDNT